MTPLEYNTQSATQEVNSQGNVNMYVVLKVQNLYSSLAQSVEHAAVNRSVVGSSPTGGVRFSDLEPRTKISGSMVKRLRHRPFTAVTGVQIPLESLYKIFV